MQHLSFGRAIYMLYFYFYFVSYDVTVDWVCGFETIRAKVPVFVVTVVTMNSLFAAFSLQPRQLIFHLHKYSNENALECMAIAITYISRELRCTISALRLVHFGEVAFVFSH